MRVISTLSLSFPEFSLYDIKASQEDVLKNAFFTAVLYGDLENKDNFIKSLDSLEKQNLIFMKIVVPSSMKTDIEKEGMLQGNLFFEDSNSKEELFVSALNNTQTPYITFVTLKSLMPPAFSVLLTASLLNSSMTLSVREFITKNTNSHSHYF